MHSSPRGRWRNLGPVGSAILLWITGCGGDAEVLPISPRQEAFNNPPAQVAEEYEGEWTISAGDQDLTQPITVARGSELELEMDPTALVQRLVRERPQYAYLVEIRLLPQGAAEQDWTNRIGPEFSAVWTLGTNSSPPPDNISHTTMDVDCAPGVYDARVYLIGHNKYEYEPTIELLAKTTVTVTE